MSHEIYNAFNNIRIIAQDGLFVYNGYSNKPLEVALKDFFVDAATYQYSPWDELDTPQSRIINEEYRIRLEKNNEFQDRLEKNIIHSYEIKKSLIPEILDRYNFLREDVYPNSENICKQIFDRSK